MFELSSNREVNQATQAILYLGGFMLVHQWLHRALFTCSYWIDSTSPRKSCQLCFHILLQGLDPKWNPTLSPVVLSPSLLAESPLSLAICSLCYTSLFWASLPQIPFRADCYRPEVQLWHVHSNSLFSVKKKKKKKLLGQLSICDTVCYYHLI